MFFCNEDCLSNDRITPTAKSIITIKQSSLAYGDDKYSKLSKSSNIVYHSICRNGYTNPKKVEAAKRKSKELDNSNVSPKKLRSSSVEFDFKLHCFFCTKKIEIRRSDVEWCNIEKLQTQNNILAKADERKDKLGRDVKGRISGIFDLKALEAKYHKICYSILYN